MFLLRFHHFLSFGTHSFVSSFRLTLCDGFYALDETAPLPVGRMGLLHRKSVPQLVVYAVPPGGGGRGASQKVSLQLLQSQSLGSKELKPLLGTARKSWGIPWAAATETRAPDVETGAPDTCKRSPLRDAGALEQVEREHEGSASPSTGLGKGVPSALRRVLT